MKNYVVEFIGAFFLVLVIGLASGDLAPLAIGGALMIMVYMGGHVSGAHYNPAVSIACLVRGALDGATTGIYIVSQVLGAVAGACAASFLSGQATTVAPGDGVGAAHALLAEFLLTFALASVVLNVATSKDHPDNSFYGLAIGFTIFVGAVSVGPISGGAFNPAVALGHNIVSGSLGNIWIYLLGPVAGAVAASLVFRITNPDEFA